MARNEQYEQLTLQKESENDYIDTHCRLHESFSRVARVCSGAPTDQEYAALRLEPPRRHSDRQRDRLLEPAQTPP